MNIFKAIICHDYSVLRARNRSIQVKTNGIHMIGLVLIANLLTIAALTLVYFLVNQGRNDIYLVLNELHYWEVAGRVGIIMILSLIYLIAFAAFGGKQYFLETIREFISMDEDSQNATSQRGFRYFYGSLLIFFISVGVLYYLIKVAGF